MKIWVDDIRKKPTEYDYHFYSVNDCINFLEDNYKDVEVLDLDHDAGSFYQDGGDYIRILDWLEFNNISVPIRIHSGNPVGVQNMWRIIKKNNWKYVEYKGE